MGWSSRLQPRRNRSLASVGVVARLQPRYGPAREKPQTTMCASLPSTNRMALACVLGAAMVVLTVPTTSATASSPCWVRNVHQDTYGVSLVRMVAKAQDGDRLRVRGTCPGEVVIDIDIMIVGRGEAPTLTVRRLERVLTVRAGASVELRDLTVEGGTVDWRGGGSIMNRGTLRLGRVIVQKNSTSGGGGGIASTGSLTVVDSIVRRNSAWYHGGMSLRGTARLVRTRVVANDANDQGGGGGLSNDGTLTIQDSIMARNKVDFGSGGGIENGGSLTLIGSTVRANVVRLSNTDEGWGSGGGITNSGTLELVGSTVTRNSSADEGGGIFNWTGGTVSLDAASSVTGNIPDDCVGTAAC